MGENFSLPVIDSAKLTTEFIKNVKNNLRFLPNNTRVTIRNRSVYVINKLPFYSPFNCFFNSKCKQLRFNIKIYQDPNPNLILTKANKIMILWMIMLRWTRIIILWRWKVCWEILIFITSLQKILQKLTSCLRDLLSRWKNPGYIFATMYRLLYCNDGVLPRAYGLPKIHKRNCP